MKTYTKAEVEAATDEYFAGDKLASNVFVTKYAMKNKEGEFVEKTPADMHRRLAKEFARIEANYPNPLSEDEIFAHLDHFREIVPQGSPMYGIGNNFVNVSLSNCVVVASPEDNVSSIMNTGRDMANLFKNRYGAGINLSKLRPDGMRVNNSAGTTTGAWSFADYYSNVGRLIGQNGRRSAEMICLDVRHPDIEKFVTMKYDLTKVTGANISVQISDDFMESVRDDTDFTLRFPVDSSTPVLTRIVRARDLWKTIVDAATKTAEPGILMWDNILKYLPAQCYASKGFDHVATNPCAELPLSAGDSCRLITVNLKSFVLDPFTLSAKFDFYRFSCVVAHAQRLSDDLVDLELEKLTNLRSISDTPDSKGLYSNLYTACANGRRTGLGTHGLADALACLNLAYDSDEALQVIDQIYSTLRDSAYTESAKLAKERGAFPVFEWELERDNAFINKLPTSIRQSMSQFGRRNISILTNAPTGSVSILSQTSSGIEPVFRNSYTRRRKLSHNDTGVVAVFTDSVGDRWSEYSVYHHNVSAYLKHNNVDDIPEFFTESNKIDWRQRVKIQGVIQQYIDHSISSTINLPSGTTPETVSDLYVLGWQLGLKGITVYVDGSRDGVLITDKPKETLDFHQHDAPKRPEKLDCDIHHVTIKGEKWTVLIGLLNGKPYEIIGGENKLIELPRSEKKGMIVKVPITKTKSRYDLVVGELVIKDVVSAFDNPNYSAFTRLLSLSLRHGAPINYVVEQMQKDETADMFSFSRSIARVLKGYVVDGTKAKGQKTCPECSSTDLVYQDGCVTCSSCGWSRCS